jgi:hypothetical protein
MNKIRTTNSIINKLARNVNHTNSGNSYLKCRLNPFAGNGGMGIPDGGNTNYIVSDTYSFDTINCSANSTDFVIQTLPCLPTMAAIIPTTVGSTTFKVNNQIVKPPVGISPVGTLASNSWYPLSICPPYLTTTTTSIPGLVTQDPWNSTKARLISVGYKLIYTGPVNTCAGVVTVTPNDVAFAPAGVTSAGSTSSPTSGVLLNINQPSQAVLDTAGTGTTVLTMDCKNSTSTMTRESISFRPETSIIITPRHRTNDFKLLPTSQSTYGIVANVGLTGGQPTVSNYYNYLTFNGTSTTGTGNYGGGIIWYDNDWESLQIVVSNCNNEASFRWETVYCFEYNPSLNSPFAPLTLKKAENKPAAIEQANAILDSRPAAIPVTDAEKKANDTKAKTMLKDMNIQTKEQLAKIVKDGMNAAINKQKGRPTNSNNKTTKKKK